MSDDVSLREHEGPTTEEALGFQTERLRTALERAEKAEDRIEALRAELSQTKKAVTDMETRALEAEEVSTRFCAGLTEIVRQFGDTPGGHMAAIIARDALSHEET